mgnify:CR=1 FL=1
MMVKKSINRSVKRLYEQFPYPNYPILSRFHKGDGYLASPSFAALLFGQSPMSGNTLLAGCGDTQPRIIQPWVPKQNRTICLDLSSKNLTRLKQRWLIKPRRTDFINEDLDNYLQTNPQNYSHIDCYGVLHHLPNPLKSIELLSHRLTAAGTIRLMVYNSKARHWIHQFQRIFALAGLSAFNKKDLHKAKHLAVAMCKSTKQLEDKLPAITASLQNDSIFVDTFFHSREARLPFSKWVKALHNCNFKHIKLLDRHSELDHLANPLLELENTEKLEHYADSGLMRGPLEIYAIKDGTPKSNFTEITTPYTPPPQIWSNFPETKAISSLKQVRLWRAFLKSLRNKDSISDQLLSSIYPTALKRLSRLGVLSKHNTSQRWWPTLESPIKTSKPLRTQTIYHDYSLNWLALLPELDKKRITLIKERFIRAIQ